MMKFLRLLAVENVAHLCAPHAGRMTTVKIAMEIADRTLTWIIAMKPEHEILKDYQIIEYIEKAGVGKIKRTGAKIGRYMAVSYVNKGSAGQYQIVKIHNGEQVIDKVFTDLELALSIALLINGAYEEYLPIWQAYPDADIISLAQWSVKNGVDICKIISEMPIFSKVSDWDKVKELA